MNETPASTTPQSQDKPVSVDYSQMNFSGVNTNFSQPSNPPKVETPAYNFDSLSSGFNNVSYGSTSETKPEKK